MAKPTTANKSTRERNKVSKMISAKELQAMTTKNSPLKILDETLEPQLKEQAAKGLDKFYFEGLKRLCPQFYSFDEWAKMVSKHYCTLGYGIQMYADKNRFWIHWE